MSDAPASDVKSLAANVAWWVWGHGFRMVATFIVGFWVIRHLGPTGFGELCIIRAVQGILNVLATMGLTQLLPIQLASTDSPAKTLITAGVVRFGGGILAAAASIPILCWIQGYGSDQAIIPFVASVLLLLTPLELLESWFVSQTKSRFTVISRMSSVAVIAGLQILAIFGGLGIVAFLAIDVVGILIYGGMLLLCMVRYLKPSGSVRTDTVAVNVLIRSSLPIWLAAAAAIISVKIDQAMLGIMLGEKATGLYAAAARLSEFWYFVPVAIISSTVPPLTRQYNKDHDKSNYRRNVLQVGSTLTSFSIAVAVGTSIIASPLVTYLFGPEFYASASVLVIHVWSLPFFALSYLSHNLRIMQGQQLSLLPRTIVGAASNIGLNLFLIPMYGINGAAFATLLSYIVGGIGWDLLVDRSQGLGTLQAKSFHPRNWVTAGSTVLSRFRTVAMR